MAFASEEAVSPHYFRIYCF